MSDFVKYITIIDYTEVDGIEEAIPLFGVDIYSKTKEEAEIASSIFNLKRLKELCVVIESTKEPNDIFSDN